MFQKIVFVDFYWVLSYTKLFESISSENHPHYKIYQQIEHFLFVTDRQVFNDWMIGKISWDDILMMISKKTGLDYEILQAIYKQDCGAVKIQEDLVHIIGELWDNIYKVLITNNVDGFSLYSTPNLPLLSQIFHEIHCSYDLWYLKIDDDCTFFKRIAREQGIPLENTCLIDDTRKNCEEFSSTWGMVFCVKTPDDIRSAVLKIEEK